MHPGKHMIDPIDFVLPSPLSLTGPLRPFQMNCARMLSAEGWFITDIAILVKLSDIPEISITAAQFGKADNLVGKDLQRLPVLLSCPTL